jgi:tetratricopeptide (TPR) repeat protein
MRFPHPILSAIAAAALLSAILGTAAFCWWRRPTPLSVELATPKLAIEHLAQFQGKRLFFTPAALPFLKPTWVQWHSAGMDEGGIEEVARQFDAAAQNPKAWRALDRTARFSALLLTGDPAGFRPLLDHLYKSPDWTLTWLDHTSFVFERSPARHWTIADLETLKAGFATHSSAERVTVEVQTAHRLIAIGEVEPAKMLLNDALKMDAASPTALTELAFADAALAQWDQALAAADSAVKADRDYLPAIAAKANALYAHGEFNAALLLVRQLIEKAPEDGQSLALFAKIAHAAHAYQEEIGALEKIVHLSQAKALSTGAWRIFLAQAYAADTQAEPALAQFEAALKEPDLTDSERSFAQKGIERIKGRKPIF